MRALVMALCASILVVLPVATAELPLDVPDVPVPPPTGADKPVNTAIHSLQAACGTSGPGEWNEDYRALANTIEDLICWTTEGLDFPPCIVIRTEQGEIVRADLMLP